MRTLLMAVVAVVVAAFLAPQAMARTEIYESVAQAMVKEVEAYQKSVDPAKADEAKKVAAKSDDVKKDKKKKDKKSDGAKKDKK
jgi:hypothetical protein